MGIFAIGDLHLSFASQKPMDVFGPQWEDHAKRIESNWRSTVSDEDVVLVPGDISWAMTLEEAKEDLAFLAALPGKKVVIRGNHDYWWHSIGKVRAALDPSIEAIQNDAVRLDGVTLCGTRGWLLPTHPKFTSEDEKIYRREVERLRMSLLAAQTYGQPIIVMIHYPPTQTLAEDTGFTQVLEEFQVRVCVYGHLHGYAHRFKVEGKKNGTQYQLASADYVDFRPIPIAVHPDHEVI